MINPNYESPWMDDMLLRFRNGVRLFLETKFVPIQERWCQQGRPDPETWKTAGAAGILLADVPRKYGGQGGFAYEAVVIEELVRSGVQLGSNVHSVTAHYILSFGSEEQKRDWLPRMVRGELVGAIAITERSAGSDLQGIKTTCRREGDHYVINGSKTFVTNGWHAGVVCLAVKTDPNTSGPKAMSLIIVETAGLTGYRVGPLLKKVGMPAQDTCEVFFEDVCVPVSNLLGPDEGNGFYQILDQLPYERVSIGIEAVGSAERAIKMTTTYVKERLVFGKRLIDFQNTRLKLAECKSEVYIGRVFIDDCIQRLIAGRLNPVTAAMAKYWLTDCQCRVIDECVQLHGGNGYMNDYPIARMWADSRVQRIYGGTNEIMKELIGSSL